MIDLSEIKNTKKTGDEEIIGVKRRRKLLDFWQWAYSDLVGNTERGAIAEYLVAVACEVDDEIRIGWDTHDLTLKNDLKVEVKSSGYLQTWKQKKLSKPIFGISKTRTWNSIKNTYDKEKVRQADVYVFALLTCTDKAVINPLNTKQWEFYVLRTSVINEQLKDSKQVSLNKLKAIGAVKTSFEKLYEIINNGI